jgi:hypothetical protein
MLAMAAFLLHWQSLIIAADHDLQSQKVFNTCVFE